MRSIREISGRYHSAITHLRRATTASLLLLISVSVINPVSAALTRPTLQLNITSASNATEATTTPIPMQLTSQRHFEVVTPLAKGQYRFYIADKQRSCGRSFAPENPAPLKFVQPIPVSDCAQDSYLELNIRFAGDYQFSISLAGDKAPAQPAATITVRRAAKASQFVRKLPEIDCLQWDGQPVTVDVSELFADGSLVRDFYSQQTATVKRGKITLLPAPQSGGLLLLENADNADSIVKSKPLHWNNAIIYSLLTDRFHNGDRSNDHSFARTDDGQQNIATWHGGDFKGVTEKLDYLQQLGVDAVWISPIYEQVHGFIGIGDDRGFPMYGYHGYWPLDFRMLDPNFGDEQALREFIDQAHQRGIRVILDVILNHAGFATLGDIQDLALPLAHATEQLPPRWNHWRPGANDRWQSVNQYIDYWNKSGWQQWWGKDWVRAGLPGYEPSGGTELNRSVGGLPDFKTESTRQVSLPPFLLQKAPSMKDSQQTVIEHLIQWNVDWIREFGFDGIRADTAKHVEAKHWLALKQQATLALKEWKQQNPAKKIDDSELWMVAEAWFHGVEKDHYFDNGFDAVINFDFQNPALKAAQCLQRAEPLYAMYAKELNHGDGYNLLSYISSHDTRLFFSGYKNIELQRNVANALLLLPGSVQIFYGDETARKAGPDGGVQDQGSRSDMNWNEITGARAALLKHWQILGQFRQRHPAIGSGQHRQLNAAPYSFSRQTEDDKVMVVFAGNR